MANDPVNPVSTETAEDLRETTEASNNLSNAFNELGGFAGKAKSALGTLQQSLESAGVKLENISTLTEKESQQLGFATTVALGASDAFKQMGDVDTTGLNLFGKQVEDLEKILISGNNAFSDGVHAAKKLAETISSATGLAFPADLISKGATAVGKYAMGFLQSADNALRLQNAVIQLSARTGELGGIMTTAGDELQNMNAILAEQDNMLNNTVKATQLSKEQVVSYYTQLGAVPKALSAIVSRSNEAGDTTSMLTATIQMATGSGRKYADILADVHEAFRMYGVTGEEALKFTARSSEISQKYGVELEDIRKGLKEGAAAFKMYGAAGDDAARMLQGASSIMNQYVGALQASGLSGAEAASTVMDMTQKLGKLTIAQRGFLSAQTGGPGGLMGAYQIEKLMKEGKIDEVMEKVRNTIMKQTGKIVTVEEAATSPEAAARLTRQRMMLQQGPLGAFAKDEQSASRILEAFKKRETGEIAVSGLKENIVQDTMKTGLKFQETSASELGNIRGILESMRSAAGITNLGTLQQTIGARTGTPAHLPGTSQESRMQERRRRLLDKNIRLGGEDARNWAETKGTAGGVSDRTAEYQVRNLGAAGDVIKNLGEVLSVPTAKLLRTMASNSAEAKKTIQKQEQYLLSQIDGFKHQASVATNGIERQRLLLEVSKRESIYKEAQEMGYWDAAKATDKKPAVGKPQSPTYHSNTLEDAMNRATEGRVMTPAEGVKRAIPAARGAVSTTTEAAKETPHAAATAASGDIGKVSLHVTGYCIKCQRDIEGSGRNVVAAINPAATEIGG